MSHRLSCFNGALGGVYDDITGNTITQTVGLAAPVIEGYRDTSFLTMFCVYDRDDELGCYKFQMSHRWARTAVDLHAHVRPCGDSTPAGGVVRLQYWWYWSQGGVALPALTTWNTSTAQKTIAVADLYKEVYVDLADCAPPASPLESQILYVRLRRPGATDAADTYHDTKTWGTAKANLEICYVDVHYQSNKIGTDTEIPV